MMDIDPNAALNDSQAYIYAMQAHPKSSAASMPPGLKPLTGTVVDTPPNKIRTYNDLPAEVIFRIGRQLPLADIGNFSAVNSQTYQAMRERRLVWSYWQRANKAVSLSSLNRVLAEIESGLKEPAQRIEPIEALRQRLQALPQAEQPEAFKRLFMAANRIPGDGITIQKALIEIFRDLPEQQRSELFDFVIAVAERRGPKEGNFWPELACSIILSSLLNPPQFLNYYETFLARLSHLEESQRAEIIFTLANLLGILGNYFINIGANVPALYAVLQEQTLRLSPLYQGLPMGTLGTAVLALPESERFFQYTKIRNLAIALPDDQWAAALTNLPLGIFSLPSDQQAELYWLLESGGLARVPPAQRVSAVLSLLRCNYLVGSNATLMKRLWQQALSLLDGSSEASLNDVLHMAKEEIVSLDKAQWQIAMDEITKFMERNLFSETSRAQIVKNWFR